MKHFNQFRKSYLNTLILFSIAASGMLALSSCGTIIGAMSKGKRPAYILNSPKDVTIKQDGKQLDIGSELFAVTGTYEVQTSYYTASILLPYKETTTLEISSGDRTGSVTMVPKGTRSIFWLNLLFCPIVGHIIDGVTDNNKTLQPRFIDVESVLNHVPFKEWPKQKKLKRMEKKKIKKAYA